jgi:hypothetical protein
MERSRYIAAAPIRSASEAWKVVCTLIADTLERSASVVSGSVIKELQCLNGIGPALIAGGHLENVGLVLADDDMYVTIQVLTADAALDLAENLNPIPGGSSATAGWVVYLPSSGPLKTTIEAAAKKSIHLSTEKPTQKQRAVKVENAVDPVVDLDALKRLGVIR